MLLLSQTVILPMGTAGTHPCHLFLVPAAPQLVASPPSPLWRTEGGHKSYSGCTSLSFSAQPPPFGLFLPSPSSASAALLSSCRIRSAFALHSALPAAQGQYTYHAKFAAAWRLQKNKNKKRQGKTKERKKPASSYTHYSDKSPLMALLKASCIKGALLHLPAQERFDPCSGPCCAGIFCSLSWQGQSSLLISSSKGRDRCLLNVRKMKRKG